MTFRIANNQIHIGWGQTLTVLVTIITAVWAIRARYDESIQTTQKTNDRLTAIERTLSLKNGKDSVQDYRLYTADIKMDSLILSINRIEIPKTRTAMRFYTEKWVNGRLQLTEVLKQEVIKQD